MIKREMKLPEILYCDCLLLIVILNIIIYEKITLLSNKSWLMGL